MAVGHSRAPTTPKLKIPRPLLLIHAHATRRNVGDDALVLAVQAVAAQAVPHRQVRFLDIARYGHSYPGEPLDGFLPLYQYHRPRYWARLLGWLGRADVIVIGGGDLLAGGVEFLGLGFLGWAAGLPVLYAGIGVNTKALPQLNRLYTTFVVRRGRAFITRDDEAASELRNLGVPPDRIQVAPDLALAFPVPALPRRGPRASGAPPRIGVSLRPEENADYPMGDPQLKAVARLLDRLVETRNAGILLLPFLDPASPIRGSRPFGTDHEVLQRTVELMRHGHRTVLYTGSLHPLAIFEVMHGLDGLIAMRLHASILGLMAGIQPLAIEYAPKIRRTMTQLGFADRVVRVCDLDAPDLVERVLADPVDPARIAALADRARHCLAHQLASLAGGRRPLAVLRLPLAFAALLVHAAVILYDALPPPSSWTRRGAPG